MSIERELQPDPLSPKVSDFFQTVPFAHDLRFNHLTGPDGKTFLQLIYVFGNFKPPLEYEVLLPTHVVEEATTIDASNA